MHPVTVVRNRRAAVRPKVGRNRTPFFTTLPLHVRVPEGGGLGVATRADGSLRTNLSVGAMRESLVSKISQVWFAVGGQRWLRATRSCFRPTFLVHEMGACALCIFLSRVC